MVRCPKCNEEIEKLELTWEAIFRCPECYEELFNNEDKAVEFLQN